MRDNLSPGAGLPIVGGPPHSVFEPIEPAVFNLLALVAGVWIAITMGIARIWSF